MSLSKINTIKKIIYPLLFVSLLMTYCEKEDNNYQVTDIDGNGYNTLIIGTQTWMASNLKTTHYSDGTALVDGTGVGIVEDDDTTKYWFVYDDNNANKATYGLLYTWSAAANGATSSSSSPNGIQGVCPAGWHLPSDEEWTTLTDFLGRTDVAGDKLKETGTTHWQFPNTGAANESGFTALPGGDHYYFGSFDYIGIVGFWWSSTEFENTNQVWYRVLQTNSNGVGRGWIPKVYGFSVRCLKD